MSDTDHKLGSNFIRHIIEADNKSGKWDGKVATRFPPEPNGYLHVGHAKSICLNFTLAQENQGTCNLRFDDTNPEAEDVEYVDSIMKDVQWLGFQWHGEIKYASDYFPALYDYAVQLIKAGKAFVCSMSPDEMREYRGTLTEPGKPSPFRDRTVEENLTLFEKMKNGEFKDGEHTLRAKIDMSSPNINMRDPVIYRIKRFHHQRTGDQWCIYPMYDYTHCISDALEKITHSICTLEFEDHRPLYDWILDTLGFEHHPQQIEFARLELNYVVTSKRKLRQLVEDKEVSGWDDPRMPTISGLRRRGYDPAAIRDFCERIGVTKKQSTIQYSTLEDILREHLDQKSPRVMCVLDPIKVVIEDYPETKTEELSAPAHPKDESMGQRKFQFSREVYIDRDDFMEDPPKKFFRLGPGREVRLRYGYIIKCNEVIKDSTGKVTELRCTHDPDTLGKNPEGRKVKGVIHWVSATDSLPCEVRMYDRLFSVENPSSDKEKDFREFLSPDSLSILKTARVEPSAASAEAGSVFQFERKGYFCLDLKDSKPGNLVFNRTVSLRDGWK